MTSRVHPEPLAAALAIARRDLLEFVRDRRTLVITLLLPMVTHPILALATALGLLVAILALLFFNYFQVRIGDLDAQLRVGLGRFLEAGAGGEGHGVR